MVYKSFFKLLVATLLVLFFFMSCSSSDPSDSSDSSDSSGSSDNCAGIVIKLTDSSIGECLTEKKDITQAFEDVYGFIVMDDSIDTIEKFTDALVKVVPSLKMTFNGDDYEFSNFLSEGIKVIKKKYPNATEDELSTAFLTYAKAVKGEFSDVGDLELLNDFVSAGITDIGGLKIEFPTATLSDFRRAGITDIAGLKRGFSTATLRDFVSAGFTDIAGLKRGFSTATLSDFRRAGITNIADLMSGFPDATLIDFVSAGITDIADLKRGFSTATLSDFVSAGFTDIAGLKEGFLTGLSEMVLTETVFDLTELLSDATLSDFRRAGITDIAGLKRGFSTATLSDLTVLLPNATLRDFVSAGFTEIAGLKEGFLTGLSEMDLTVTVFDLTELLPDATLSDFVSGGITDIAGLKRGFSTATLSAFVTAFGEEVNSVVSSLKSEFSDKKVGNFIRAGITDVNVLTENDVFPASGSSDPDYKDHVELAIKLLGENSRAIITSLSELIANYFMNTAGDVDDPKLQYFLRILFPQVTILGFDFAFDTMKDFFLGTGSLHLATGTTGMLVKWRKLLKAFYPMTAHRFLVNDLTSDSTPALVIGAIRVKDYFILRVMFEDDITLGELVSAGFTDIAVSSLKSESPDFKIGDFIRAGITNADALTASDVFPASGSSDPDYKDHVKLAIRLLGQNNSAIITTLSTFIASDFMDDVSSSVDDLKLKFFLLILFPQTSRETNTFSFDSDFETIKNVFFGAGSPRLATGTLGNWKILLKAFYPITVTSSDVNDLVVDSTRDEVTSAIGVRDDFILKVMFEYLTLGELVSAGVTDIALLKSEFPDLKVGDFIRAGITDVEALIGRSAFPARGGSDIYYKDHVELATTLLGQNSSVIITSLSTLITTSFTTGNNPETKLKFFLLILFPQTNRPNTFDNSDFSINSDFNLIKSFFLGTGSLHLATGTAVTLANWKTLLKAFYKETVNSSDVDNLTVTSTRDEVTSAIGVRDDFILKIMFGDEDSM